MTSELLLLPSQEALVQRLQHTASYCEQLLLLCGAKGAGKSTLSAALASVLDNYNSALVLCPQHADASEIRRKIWVQLVSSPIFDDELPLMDTLSRLQTELTQPLHIIIDDAHLLPKSLWVECILLAQMRCAGAPVAITMVMDENYLSVLYAELGRELRELLLPINIEPLSLAEREGLYQSLLLRSEQTSFIPRETIHQQLMLQQGTPAEVVDLLVKALSKPEKAKSLWQSKGVKLTASMMLASLSSALIYYVFLLPVESEVAFTGKKQLTAQQTLKRELSQKYLINYAENLLGSLISTTSDNDNLLLADIMQLSEKKTKVVSSSFTFEPVSLSQTEANTEEQKDPQTLSEAHATKTDDKEKLDEVQATITKESVEPNNQTLTNPNVVEANVDESEMAASAQAVSGSPQGYTLQLASVKERRSLNSIVAKIKGQPNIYIAYQKQRYMLLAGEYPDKALATQQAENLKKQGLNQPWLRSWNDLAYEQLFEVK